MCVVLISARPYRHLKTDLLDPQTNQNALKFKITTTCTSTSNKNIAHPYLKTSVKMKSSDFHLMKFLNVEQDSTFLYVHVNLFMTIWFLVNILHK